jgi:hypothetical protein
MKIEKAPLILDATAPRCEMETRCNRIRSAEWHSAVSQVGNLRVAPPLSGTPVSLRRSADCQSAIQQIHNLRYDRASASRHQH